MSKNEKINRRQFLGTAATFAAFTIVPRHVLGGAGYKPPSEKLNIASIGAGGMAASNLEKCCGENIVALCDVDDERAKEMYGKYPDVPKYRDFREMLKKEEKNIDAVIIATPDHTHAIATMMAMKMGKHVYTQKPLTRTVYEARQLTLAARKYKVATQMGNQGHSGEGVRLVKEWIADGAIGPIREVHCWSDRPFSYWPQGVGRPEKTESIPSTLDWDLWLGGAPARPYNSVYVPFNWRGRWDFGCGALGDMGCHTMDAPFWALDLLYPTSVEASFAKNDHIEETAPLAAIINYQFPARGKMPPVKLVWYDGGLLPPRPAELEAKRKLPRGGTIFIGDKGKIMCGTYGDSPRIIPETKMQEYKRPPKTVERIEKGIPGHEQNWIDACKGGKPACSNFDSSGPLTETVVMGNLAIRAGCGIKLDWDGKNMQITNLPELNKYVKEPYRQNWSL